MKIYVISGGGYSKIGFSRDPKKRLSVMQTGNPHELKVTLAVEVPDEMAHAVEGAAHGFMPFGSRKYGEWFKTRPDAACRAVHKAVKQTGVGTKTGTDRCDHSPEEIDRLYELALRIR